MLTAERIEAHRVAQSAIRDAARRELEQWWASAYGPGMDPVVARASLTEMLAYLSRKYGDAAAGVAADLYDDMRASAGVEGAFRAVLADAVPAGQVEASARWAAGPLWRAEPDGAAVLRAASAVTDRWVKRAATGTVYGSAVRDPARPRVARVPRGTATCAFCVMLASRGAVYVSAGSAGGVRRFHGGCDCETVTVFRGDRLPAGYDLGTYRDMYSAAVRHAGSSDASRVLAAMREMHDLS